MGGVCSTHGRDGKGMQYFLLGNMERRDRSKDVGVGGRIVLNEY
jgi:hypothetical protein